MHHIFDIEIAKQYGVNAAIILQNIEYWITYNKANEKCFYEGRYWTYSSVRAFEELFPYLSGQQIRTALQKLMDDEVIIKGCFNKTGMDRTTWYAITEKGEVILNGGRSEQEPQEINPFGDYSDDDSGIPDTVETYAAQNLDRLSPGNMQEFGKYKCKLPDDVIRHAIDEACAAGVRSWNYVRRILDRYIESGFKTMAQVLASEDSKARRFTQTESHDNPLLRAKFY